MIVKIYLFIMYKLKYVVIYQLKNHIYLIEIFFYLVTIVQKFIRYVMQERFA